ncbi:ABC transporter permease [Corynebacterium uterequi]|uniref:ABC-type spermidine/putrescine transport system, permease component II n=1 Tax=Corynebacterium uterequi TaxID=1072256 RepID=A0A0G3HH33_9CORY|nr:ABC transporter permease subunit [Corynebacterium uterequi]AKK11223.1 ABC-type spermidine/putrescine transport system, permease component II [Corynebacterium uterequi]
MSSAPVQSAMVVAPGGAATPKQAPGGSDAKKAGSSFDHLTVGRILSWIMLVFIVLPVLATLVAATSIDFSQGPWGKGITLDWFILGWMKIGPMILRSFLVAMLVVALNLLIVGPFAWYAPNLPGWLKNALTSAVNIPLAIPGIALSISLIGTFAGLRPSGVLLICGHLIFTMPFTMSALMPSLADTKLREAQEVARSLGASWYRVITTITIPWVNVSVLQAITMVFAISFGEFNISFFINPPATPMAPFALFDAYSTQRLEIASAMSCIFIAFTIPVLAAVVWARTRVSNRGND